MATPRKGRFGAPRASKEKRKEKPGVVKKARMRWLRRTGKNVGKSAALSAAGAATSAAILWAARRNPQIAPHAEAMVRTLARHPWMALSAYMGLRTAKAGTDFLLLRDRARGGRRAFNQDPLQTLGHQMLRNRSIPGTRRRISDTQSAAAMAGGSFVADTGKQLLRRPVMGLGAVHTNPAELVFTGVGLGWNLGILGARAVSDVHRRSIRGQSKRRNR